jgi:hypothetical protein
MFKILFTLICLLSVNLRFIPMASASLEGIASLPDPGISDDRLAKLGRKAAIKLLNQNLTDPDREKFYRGIVAHIISASSGGNFASTGTFSNATTDSFIRFIESNIVRNADIGQTNSTLYIALSNLGKHGNERGIEYLSRWLNDPNQLKRVRCRDYNSTVADSQRTFLSAAFLGLGYSGNPKALTLLRKFQNGGRQELTNIGVREHLNTAIRASEIIKKAGPQAYFRGPKDAP